MAEKKKKSIFAKIFSKRVLVLLQLIASIVFLVIAYRLKMIPVKYFTAVVGIVVIIWILSILFMNSGIKKKKKEDKKFKYVVSKLVSIILTIALVVASVAMVRGDQFISNITGSTTQTRVIACYVLKDSPITTAKELKGKKIGVQYSKGKDQIIDFEAALKKKVGSKLSLTTVDDYTKLADDLYDGKVDAIIADQAYLSLLEANHENFGEETRIIYKTEIKEKIGDSTKATDVTTKPFIIYLTGLDTYGTVSTVSRTDVNLLLCVNPNTKQILMVSIPRDTEVKLNMNGKMDKITHSAIYGIDETIKTMEDFLDTNINYYAKTNFQGITNIIDAVDGITINSPHAFTTRHGNYKIVKGKNEMDGEKALCFVRERYALPNGDFDRGKNQQLLLKALIKKCLSTKIISNYDNILSAVEGSFETNMSSSDIKSLVNMQLDEGGSWDMKNVQLQGEGHKTTKTYSMKGQNVFTLKPDKDSLSGIKKAIDKIEEGKKLKASDVDKLE